MKFKGAEAIVKSLVEHDVKMVYGLPGSHILDIYDYLRDENRIKHILVMHEVNAAFMADAHGRLTGRPGLCLVTCGPGATNAVTGIAQAYAEASPVIQITGYTSPNNIVQPDHCVDDLDFMLKIYQPLTKWSKRIERVEDIPATLDKAFAVATSDRPGPVHLEIPKDVLARSGRIGTLITSSKSDSLDIAPSVKAVAEILNSAVLPMIAVGRGVLREFCSDEVVKLANSLGAPILTLSSAISAIPYQCPFYLGYDLEGYGHKFARWLRHPLVSSLIRKADVILTLGFDLGERLTCFREKNGKLIHVHHDASTLDDYEKLAPKPMVDIKTSVKNFVELLEKEIKHRQAGMETIKKQVSDIKSEMHDDIARSIRWGNKPIHPGEIATQLRRILDDDAIVTLDVGTSESWMKLCYRARKSNTILASGRYSSMGFSLPAAIAAKINFPERQVVAVTGDGGFLMSYMDFPTLIKYRLGIVVIVETNRRYGTIWQMQRTQYRGRTFATEIEIPNFAEYARAFGATAVEVKSANDLNEALEEAVNVKGPVLVDIDTEYKFPSYLPTKIARLGRKIRHHLEI